ncbi:MAG: GNAT family N-acetyltransferase [Planctomycetes bacterium]|nr:GNAT family N-acetyltransferase [Planctomycetota bacterium]
MNPDEDEEARRPIAESCGIYRLHERHVDALQVLASDAAVAATTRIPHPYPADGARVFFELMQREREAGTAHVFAIEEDGRFVGLCGFHGIVAGRAELGFWVGRPFWGRGIGAHAAAAALRVGFDYLRLEQVWAEALADNVGSRRILERLGMRRTGERAHGSERWPAAVPLVRYEIDRAGFAGATNGPSG